VLGWDAEERDHAETTDPRDLSIAAACPLAVAAGTHTWDARGLQQRGRTIQFVPGGERHASRRASAPARSSNLSFAIGNGVALRPRTVVSPRDGGLAALPGARCPTRSPPAANVPFQPAGDTVSFVGIDSWTFGPVPAVPTDGIASMDRISGIGPNTPKNYAGVEGTVDASGGGGADVPLLPLPVLGYALS
jgi:hypothetical protein